MARGRPRLRKRAVLALREFIYRRIGISSRQRQVWRENGADDPDLSAYLKSHICLHPFRNLNTTNRGQVHVCCPDWLPTPIGTMDEDLLQQWNGEAATKIRESILDGSYRYCSRKHCPAIANRTLYHRDSVETRIALSVAPNEALPPASIGLSHDRSCNLACPSCRKDFIVADKAEQKRHDELFSQSLVPLLQFAERAYITGTGDPFGSNHFRSAIKRLAQHDLAHVKIDLHTNGQLFDERAWRDLQLGGRVENVEISIDAASPETYAHVRRGGSFERLLKNLAFIRSLRQSGEIKSLDFSFVVQARNFYEMPAFVRLGEDFCADAVNFHMIRNWGTYSAAEFRAEFIGDPSHPDHPAFVGVCQAPGLRRSIVRAADVLAYTRQLNLPPEDHATAMKSLLELSGELPLAVDNGA